MVRRSTGNGEEPAKSAEVEHINPRFYRVKDFPGSMYDKLSEFGSSVPMVLLGVMREVIADPVKFFAGEKAFYKNIPAGDIFCGENREEVDTRDSYISIKEGDKRANRDARKFKTLMEEYLFVSECSRDVLVNICTIYINRHTRKGVANKIDLSTLTGVQPLVLDRERLERFPKTKNKETLPAASPIRPYSVADMNRLIDEHRISGDPRTQAADKQAKRIAKEADTERLWRQMVKANKPKRSSPEMD